MNIFSLCNNMYKSVLLSLIWLHSLVCQIHNKQMSQLVAHSGNICELFHVMNVGVDRATLASIKTLDRLITFAFTATSHKENEHTKSFIALFNTEWRFTTKTQV